MSKAWKHLDLAGGGLQSANVRLALELKKRWLAYALLAVFPLGLHRYYLRDRRGPWLYATGTSAAAILAVAGQSVLALALAALVLAVAIFDAFWIDRRITEVNKQIRKDVYLGHAATPPIGYRGRVTESDMEDYIRAKESERAGHQPLRQGAPDASRPALSLAEQEDLLAKNNDRKDRSRAP